MSLVLLLVALALVLVFRSVVGERASSFVEGLTGDPGVPLPPSVLDRSETEPDSNPAEPARGRDATVGR